MDLKNCLTNKSRTANSSYKKLAVQWLIEHLSFVSSSVVAESFRLRNRQLLVAAKRCGEIRSAPFATTFARITSASCAAASRTSHNKRICKILKSRTSSDLELHKSARTLAAIFPQTLYKIYGYKRK